MVPNKEKSNTKTTKPRFFLGGFRFTYSKTKNKTLFKFSGAIISVCASIIFFHKLHFFDNPSFIFDSSQDKSNHNNTYQQNVYIGNNNPRVLGDTPDNDFPSIGDDVTPALLPFDIPEWSLEKGLFLHEGYICSRGRSDRPILAVNFKRGLMINERVSANILLGRNDRMVDLEHKPKAVLIFDQQMMIVPGVDIQRIEFNDFKHSFVTNKKLQQPVDITMPIIFVFEPAQILSNKLSFKYYLKFMSTDKEISTPTVSTGSFETYYGNDDPSLPRMFAIGLYEGSCIRINTFDVGSRNSNLQNYPYFN